MLYIKITTAALVACGALTVLPRDAGAQGTGLRGADSDQARTQRNTPPIRAAQLRDARASTVDTTEAQWEMIVFPLATPSSDITRTLANVYADVDWLRIYPASSGTQLIVRVHPDHKTEIVNLLRQLDRPTRTIVTEILLVQAAETGVELQDGSGLASQVARLLDDGKLTVQQKIRLSGLENAPQSAQYGHTARQTVESQQGPRNVTSYRNVEFGTQVTVMGRAADAGGILIELEFTTSSAGADPQVGPSTAQFQSALRLKHGVPSLVHLVSNPNTETWLLVTASVEAAPDAPPVGGNSARFRDAVRPRNAAATTPSNTPAATTARNPDQQAALTRYAKQFIERYDGNGNGRIDAGEKTEFIARFPEIAEYADDGLTVEEMTAYLQMRLDRGRNADSPNPNDR